MEHPPVYAGADGRIRFLFLGFVFLWEVQPAAALTHLTKTTAIPEFKSKDGDLNEFLMQEAKDYQEQLLAVTYLLQNPKTGDIVAYFSLLNDIRPSGFWFSRI